MLKSILCQMWHNPKGRILFWLQQLNSKKAGWLRDLGSQMEGRSLKGMAERAMWVFTDWKNGLRQRKKRTTLTCCTVYKETCQCGGGIKTPWPWAHTKPMMTLPLESGTHSQMKHSCTPEQKNTFCKIIMLHIQYVMGRINIYHI